MTDAPSSASVENACRYNSKGRSLFGKTPSSLNLNCSGSTNSCCLTVEWACICNAISRAKSEPVVLVKYSHQPGRVLPFRRSSVWQRNTAEAAMQEPTGVSQLVGHLFRHEAGKMVATLTRIFGIERWNLAEDVVQEALSRALQTWPYRGIPENPSAWIMRASRNLALDVIRREKVFRGKETEIARLIEGGGSSTPEAVMLSENEIADD